MQQHQQQTASLNQIVKQYKKWVNIADHAAKVAKQENRTKETYPAYIAADNIARTLFAKLQRTA